MTDQKAKARAEAVLGKMCGCGERFHQDNTYVGCLPCMTENIAAALNEKRVETIRECADHGCMWCTARAEKLDAGAR